MEGGSTSFHQFGVSRCSQFRLDLRWKLLTFASCTCKVQCWKLSFDRFRHAWIEVPLQSLDYETARKSSTPVVFWQDLTQKA